MSSSTIRGEQIRLATIARNRIDPAFEASLAAAEANISSIFNQMSTDAERMAAIDALTTAFQSADGTLQGMITSMVNATRVGSGLNTDGTYTLPVGENYLTGATTIAGAVALLDAALKIEANARVAGDAALTAQVNDLVAAGGATAAADLAAEATRAQTAEAALDAKIVAETSRATTAETSLQTAITNEANARTLLNTTLSDSIAAEAVARTNAINSLSTALATADTTLQNNIDAEALARTTADGIHTAQISTEVARAQAAELQEATDRAAADAALSGRVDTLESAVASNLTYDKFVNRETPTGTVDGTNTLFVLANMPHLGSESVFLNGMLQEPGVGNDYTINGKDVTLIAAPQTGDRVRVTYFR